MRFIPVLITIILLTIIPTLSIVIETKKCRYHRVISFVAILTPLLYVVVFWTIHANCIGMRLIEWCLWSFMTIYCSLNSYYILHLLDILYRVITKKHSNFFSYIGIGFASIGATLLISGMIMRHHIEVREITIESERLPQKFDGLRIAHITDLHLGTLSPRDKYLNKIVTTLKDINPDILCFTGDLVNLDASEGKGLEGLFSAITTRYGRYAVMGNHDYGDYVKWENSEDRLQNIAETKSLYKEMGFKLFNDSAAYISNEGDTLGIIGVENWGTGKFPRYGDMTKAVSNWCPANYNILLTHDPTHWSKEITKSYSYVDLTLSGHTHAAQCGFAIGKKQFSPSSLIYNLFGGLYTQGTQNLFISRGLGYVGLPFRLGMWADISIITLRSK